MQKEPNLHDVQNTIPVDTLVHMGAGRCSELDEYLTLEPRQLLLVEADSHLADDLQNRIVDVKQAQVSCVAISGTPGQATLYRYNLPEANSLHAASGLMTLFPGLKLVEQQQVKTVSPVSLLQPLQLQAKKVNRLVIDLPGEELPVLQVLQQSQQLELFSQVYLYCGREPLYEGSKPAIQVLKWLQHEGFDLLAENNSRDPDRPCWKFRRNPLQLHNRELQGQVEQLIGKNEELVRHAADLQSQVQQLEQDQDAQAKHAGELKSRINELTQLAKERQAQIDQLTKQQNDQVKLVADLNNQLEQETLAKIEAEKVATDQRNKLEDAIKTSNEQVKIAKDHQKQVSQLIDTESKQKRIIENQKAEIDKIKVLLQESTNRSTQLEAELPTMETRHQLLNEELIKAEGQIDLIKDLLLRDPGL